jgi:hypothetical protein
MPDALLRVRSACSAASCVRWLRATTPEVVCRARASRARVGLAPAPVLTASNARRGCRIHQKQSSSITVTFLFALATAATPAALAALLLLSIASISCFLVAVLLLCDLYTFCVYYINDDVTLRQHIHISANECWHL